MISTVTQFVRFTKSKPFLCIEVCFIPYYPYLINKLPWNFHHALSSTFRCGCGPFYLMHINFFLGLLFNLLKWKPAWFICRTGLTDSFANIQNYYNPIMTHNTPEEANVMQMKRYYIFITMRCESCEIIRIIISAYR